MGKWLVEHGFKVGIIAQPEVDVPDDITRLGEPNLFFAISGGCVGFHGLQNYTATKREGNKMILLQAEKIIKDQIGQF